MAKQLNQTVNLSFTADVNNAKAALEELKSQLTNLTQSVGSTSPLGITDEIKDAITQTTKLQVALKNATTSSGKLDLGQFHQELQKANLDAEKIATSLSSLGTQGQAAFAKLTQSITLAEVPLRKTNTLLTEFATTLKNTARWQISSSILHGFMGSLQSAYGYAQDLNESLTNIRIVTGQSTDQMAEFAKQANESAKALSTTTTAYTDAALIFYQQGLTGDAVTERTDTVIKMANVTGQSAEEVSSYMTAIWNNFDDGSESLEHYADVITNLGAHTASSSAEIAEGLEKFASVGETVGLSYDYATTALATVVAQTRQSADTVGTAFKTLFARIQDLELGDTLEDGTDLGTYSQALDKIGVSIKDDSGEVKDMNDILDEMGAKWQTISKDEQIAVAQAVAGTRQYTQLIALMDNWDTFQENLTYAENSDGTLEGQAEIYAQSWEGAQKRVKAAMQEIYDQLLDDSAFISITNGVAEVVNSISDIINAMGGLKGTLALVSTVMLKMFGSDISTAINNFVYNIQLGTQKGKDAILQTRKDFNEQLIAMADTGTGLGSAQVEIYKQQASVQQDLISKADTLHAKNKEISADEQTQIDLLMDISNKMGEEYQQATLNLEKLKQQSQELQTQATQVGNVNAFKTTQEDGTVTNKYGSTQEYQNELKVLTTLQEAFSEVERLKLEFFSASEMQGDSAAQKALEDIIKKLDEIEPLTEKDKDEVVELKTALENLSKAKGTSAINKNFQELEDILARIGGVADEGFDELIDSITGTDTKSKRLKKTLEELREAARATGQSTADAAIKSNNYSQSITTLREQIAGLTGTTATAADRIVALGSALSSFSMMINSIKGIMDTISDPDMSGWDKFVAILGSVGLLLPTMITSIGQVSKAFGVESSVIDVLNAKFVALKATKLESQAADAAELAMSEISGKKRKANVEIILEEIAARKLDISSMSEEQVIAAINNIAKDKNIKLNQKQVAAIYAKLVAQQASNTATETGTAVQTAFNASLLACPITWIVAGLAAIVAALTIYEKHLEKVAEAQRELNQEEYDASKTQFENAKSEADNITSLYQSYIDAQNSLDGTKEAKENLKSATEDLCEALGVEWDALDKLQGKYGDVNKAILEAQQKKIQETIDAAQTEIDDANDVVEDKVDSAVEEYDFGHSTGMNADGSNYDRLYTNIDYGLSYGGAGDSADEAVLSSFTDWLEKNYSDKIYNSGRDAQGNAMGAIQFNEGVSESEAIEILREGFAYLRDEGGFDTTTQDDSEAYQWLRTLYNDTDTSDVLTTIDTAQTTIDESMAQLAGIATQLAGTDYSQVTEDNYADYRDAYIEQLKTTMEANGQDTSKYSAEEYEQIADDYLSTFTNIAEIINNLDLKDSIMERVSGIEGGEDFINQVAEEGNLDLFASIQIDEDTSLENIKAQYEQVKAQAELEDINVKINASTDAIDSLLEGKDLTEDQLTALQDLESEYGELATIQDKNSAEYLNKLIEIREALEAEQHEVQQLAEDSKIDDIEVNIDNAETESQIEDIQNELLDLCNQDYDILVNVKSDIQDDFDTAVSAMDNIEEAASKIGDDFIVAGEDIEELNDVFPGILANMEYLGDGTVQLNSEIVQSAMDAAEAEVAADTDATVQKLQNQATELAAKRDAAQNIATIASNLVGTEKISDEQKGELDTALNQLKSDNSEATSDQVQTDDANIADTAAQASTSMANSFGSAYQQMAQDAVTFATTAHQALLAATDENQAVPSVGNFGGANFSTTADVTTTSSNKADLSNFSDYSNVDNWQEVSDYYSNLADSYDTAYNNTIGKINELLARGQGSSNSFSNISKGTGSDGKSSSNSGGSTKDPEQKDTEDHIEEEAELYHEVNEAIKDTEHELTKLDKEQSHMYGGELIASLKNENKLLSQQRANYQELNAEISQRNEDIAKSLSAYGDVDDYYATYNGIQAAYNSAVDSYNSLVNAYNSMTAEQQEAYKSTLEAAKTQLDIEKDNYDKRMDYLEEYYDNKDQMRSNDEKQQELLYQQIENNLEAYEAEIELKLDTTEAERTLAEFLKKMKTDIKNTYKTTSEWGAEFEADQTNASTHVTDANTHMSQLATYKQMYANGQWGGEDDLFASESEVLNAIVEAEKQVLEDGNTLLEDYEDAYEDLEDAFGEAVDQFDDIIDDFDRINDTIDHYQKVNELLYGDSKTGRQNAATAYQVEAENSLAKQSSLNSYIQTLQQRRTAALAAGYDEDDDYIKKIDQEINDKTSELESTIESYIDTIQAQLENSIQMAKEEMDESIWGDSLENVQQEWDDKKAMAEGYYDEVEKIYEIESLESKWQSAINSTSSLKAQQQLKDLMEAQVSALEDKTDLSEKDVELAEKEIAVYQAQIALEEAQNSKNSMKLTRDESGNWSYQYVADEDNIADKQQDYLDKLNEYRTAAVNASEEVEESIMNAYSDFSERMSEIMMDVTLSDEERDAKIQELNETYYGPDGIITKAVEDSNYLQSVANQATFQELWGLYEADPSKYQTMTESEQALIDGLRDNGITSYQTLTDFIIGTDKNSGVYGDILTAAKTVNSDSSQAWNSMASNAIEKMYGANGKYASGNGSVTDIISKAYTEMKKALGVYDKAIDDSETASGTEWSNVEKQLVGEDGNSGVKGKIGEVTDKVQGVIDKIEGLGQFEQAVLGIKNQWDATAESIRGATSDLQTYLSLLNSGGSSGDSGSDSSGSDSGGGSDSGSDSSGGSDAGGSSGGDGNLSVGDTATYSGKYYYTSAGASPTGSKYSGVTNGVVVDMINDKYGEYSVHIHSADGAYGDLGWVKPSQLSGYDTGGYTGSWDGGEGRLALLHSKELVLNADDTSNFLTAVSAIRDIASLGSISNSVASGVASLVKSMLGFDTGLNGAYGSSDGTAEGNTFNITAEFPNANNVDDIREAILSLPTLASQYLSRNTK